MQEPSQEAIAMIRRLVAFDTTSHRSNLPLIEYVRDYLSDLHVESHLTFDNEGRKANLIATIGATAAPGLMLAGHTDVVPVDGQQWLTPPFELVARDDRLHGRGTCDMKGFLGVVLATVPRFLRTPLERPLHIALTHDEETDCSGVRHLLPLIEAMPHKPFLCIVGEPTEMDVVSGHKGRRVYRCSIQGRASHSSRPYEGVNAVEVAAEIVGFIRELALRLRVRGPFDDAYFPPHATLHTNIFNGGSAINIIPANCTFEFELRYLPAQEADGLIDEIKNFADRKLLPAMKAVAPTSAISFEMSSETLALDASGDTDALELSLSLAGTSTLRQVSFGTEAGFYRSAGVPTVVCGPGSIEQAHKPDEFITLEQVSRCEAFVARILTQLKGGRVT